MFNRRHFLIGAASAGMLGAVSAPTEQPTPRRQSTSNPDSSVYTALAFAYGIVLDNPQECANWSILSGVLANCTHEWHKSNRDATLRTVGSKVPASKITVDRLNVNDLTNTMQTLDPDFSAEEMKETLSHFNTSYVPRVYNSVMNPKIGMTAYLRASTRLAASAADHLASVNPISARKVRKHTYLQRVAWVPPHPESNNTFLGEGGGDPTGDPTMDNPYLYCPQGPNGGCFGPGGQYRQPSPFCEADMVGQWVVGSAMLIIAAMATYTDTFEFVDEWQAAAKAGGVGVAAWSQLHKAIC